MKTEQQSLPCLIGRNHGELSSFWGSAFHICNMLPPVSETSFLLHQPQACNSLSISYSPLPASITSSFSVDSLQSYHSLFPHSFTFVSKRTCSTNSSHCRFFKLLFPRTQVFWIVTVSSEQYIYTSAHVVAGGIIFYC